MEGIPFSTLTLDRNGDPLQLSLTDDEKYRSFTPLELMPHSLKEGILLQEDRWFYFHPGVNPVSLVRGFYVSYIAKERKVGGSTITMQLARLYYGLNTSSVAGKINQIFKAMYLEIYYSKAEILEAYLNLAPCGYNLEGFPAAGLYYFGKPPEQLTLSEAFLLAVIPQDPGERIPQIGRENRETMDARQRLFDRWVNKYPADLDQEISIKLPPQLVNRLPFRAPHFVRRVSGLRQDERRLHTTLDLDIQTMAENQLNHYIQRKEREGIKNGALMIVDTRSREILASIGSADFFSDAIAGQVDGTTAKRSPGSTLSPLYTD